MMNNNSMKLKPWNTTREVAEYLGVSARTVTRLVRKGALHATKLGRLVRISAAAVLAYLNGHSVT